MAPFSSKSSGTGMSKLKEKIKSNLNPSSSFSSSSSSNYGDNLNHNSNSSENQSNQQQSEMQIEVPIGKRPGDNFTVKTPDGQFMSVTVPKGSKPGTKLTMLYEPKEKTSSNKDSSKKNNNNNSSSDSNSQSNANSNQNQDKHQRFLAMQAKAYEDLQKASKSMKKVTKNVVIEIPGKAKVGDTVQVRLEDGQLIQIKVPEVIDRSQPFVNAKYETYVKTAEIHGGA